jgi:hypothetical protein
MKMNIARLFKPIVLSSCIGAWAFAGSAHAAGSHVYPAVGCQEMYVDHDPTLYRANGFIQSDNEVWITCPIVTDPASTQIKVTVFYQAGLIAAPTYVGKPDLFTCELQGYNGFDAKTVNLHIRNNQTLEGSLKLSMAASPRFNVLACYLLGTQRGFYFGIYGYQVDET